MGEKFWGGTIAEGTAPATRSSSFELKPLGMLVKAKRTPTFEEWEALGKRLQQIEGALQWWVGDWLNVGEQSFGEQYVQAIESTGWQADTLRNYQWVAGKVPIENRRADLSFFHHREVAELEAGQQGPWLDKAASEGWTVARLRAELNAAKSGKDETWVLILAKNAEDAESLREQFSAEGRKVKIRDPRKKKEAKQEALI